MKKLINKRQLFLYIIICIIIITIISIVLLFNRKNNNIFFKSSYENHAWSHQSYGYYIYLNGNIKEYDDYNNNKKLKSSKISNKELLQLKELASMVEDKYEEDHSSFMFDAGTSTEQIYNNKLSKWVLLSKSGDNNGKNSTETSEKILELTRQLYNKYLKDN